MLSRHGGGYSGLWPSIVDYGDTPLVYECLLHAMDVYQFTHTTMIGYFGFCDLGRKSKLL